MNNIQTSLTTVFGTNFVAYYRAHAAHTNTTGRFFYSDHKLLGKIYEDLQSQIDTLAELLRTVKGVMPKSISESIKYSKIDDSITDGDSDDLLSIVYDDLETMMEVYEDLKNTAEDGYTHIANYAQDRLLTLNKFCWMIRSTIGDDYEDEDEENYYD
jgi:DNA-binding ferritin-like protein